MVEEYDSIFKNNAWVIVPIPFEKSMVGSRWIYKVKKYADGSVEKYKPYLRLGNSHRLRG